MAPARPFGERRARTPEQIDRLIASQPWSELDAPLARAGADPAARERLRQFARMVAEWNSNASNLISGNDEKRIVARHLLESIAVADWLKSSGCTRWLDLGSGAGFPAIPLAVAGVPGAWTLVESRRTKTLFLRKAVETLGLDRVQVELGRLEDVVDVHAGAFDGFTSRATMRLGPTLDLAARVVAPGGSAFLWKGSGRDEEMVHDRAWMQRWELVEWREIGSGPVAIGRFKRRPVD
jgi:16S rRNA (guanine527-N7)-methyltransferase